jgi:hypothetical protein
MRTINFTLLAALSCMVAMIGAIPTEPAGGAPPESTNPDQLYVLLQKQLHGEGRGSMSVLTFG